MVNIPFENTFRKCSQYLLVPSLRHVLLLVLLSYGKIQSQNLSGKVMDRSDSTALPGVTLYWLNSTVGTQTDSNGTFVISRNGQENNKLVIGLLGFKTDTVEIINSDLKIYLDAKTKETEEVLITKENTSSYIAIDPIKTEVITRAELGKAACCDLAGCFETQATVAPMTTNVITNSKELRILGLSGVYNQILIDGMPLVQGLSYTYGISGYPGTLVRSIYITKGANSVLQGYESITGSINVILKEPKDEKFFANLYMNSFLEKHANVNYSKSWKKWSTLGAFHTVQPSIRIDRDKDDFLDLPLLTRYMLYNKWRYSEENQTGLSSLIGLRYLNEERIGGQTGYTKALGGSNSVYGQSV